MHKIVKKICKRRYIFIKGKSEATREAMAAYWDGLSSPLPCTLWVPLLLRGVATQRDFTRQLLNVSVPRPGLGYWRRSESKKPVGASFLWSVMAASPMYDPPTSPDAPRVVVGSRPELTMAQRRASGAPTGIPERPRAPYLSHFDGARRCRAQLKVDGEPRGRGAFKC